MHSELLKVQEDISSANKITRSIIIKIDHTDRDTIPLKIPNDCRRISNIWLYEYLKYKDKEINISRIEIEKKKNDRWLLKESGSWEWFKKEESDRFDF